MVQLNWEEVRRSPFTSVKILFLVSWRLLKLALGRLMTIHHSHETNLENAAKSCLLLTINTFNHMYILSAPSTVEKSTPLLKTQEFDAFIVSEGKHVEEADILLLFCHGGGYSIGHPLQYRDTYWRWIRTAASMGFKLAVVALRYPLTPRYTYPTQLQAAIAAYRYLVDNKAIPAKRIVIAGDSAGGNLAAALLLYLRDHAELKTPGGAVLLSPWLDLTLSRCGNSPLLDVDLIVNPGFMKEFLVPMLTAGKYKPDDPRISPALSPSMRGLPPQLVLYGTAEVLQEDSKAWIRQCEKDEVHMTVFAGQGGLHCFGMGGLACDKRLEIESDTVILGFLYRIHQL